MVGERVASLGGMFPREGRAHGSSSARSRPMVVAPEDIGAEPRETPGSALNPAK
jgi:hypothetical protein